MSHLNYVIIISGVVQGIGFRPSVYRIAKKHSINGKIYNSPEGVKIEVSSDNSKIKDFINDIRCIDVPGIRIDNILVKKVNTNLEYRDFIIERTENGLGISEFPIDSKICKNCIEELFSKGNRHLYPLTACTQCGPRFTVIEKLPYDRQHTTMKYFSKCKECEKLYTTPESSRFNFETDSCWNCSPWIGFIDFKNKLYYKQGLYHSEIEKTLQNHGFICSQELPCNDVGMRILIKKAQEQLINGNILAIKGIGGYQLVVDAKNINAVQELRYRKQRKKKPLAIMLKNSKEVLKYCYANRADLKILDSRTAPIVLLRSKNVDLAPNITMGTRNLGVMLPYSPLHKILVEFPVVVTSANISGDPIIFEDNKLDDLGFLSDYAIVHDRPITMGLDDSLIINSIVNKIIILRYARGFIPNSYEVEQHDIGVLACGSELKNTFTLTKKNKMYLSQYNGDLKNKSVKKRYVENLSHFECLFGINVGNVVVDLHPEYYSRTIGLEIAKKRGIFVFEVQHHFAHALSVMAEHKIREECVGIILDGGGYGIDKTIWGGEILRVTTTDYERLAHFEKLKLIGNEKAVKEPYRQIVCIENRIDEICKNIFNCSFFETRLGKKCQKNTLFVQNRRNLAIMRDKNINIIETSSAGRVFDLAAAILLNIEIYEFEGEAAIKIEDSAKKFLDNKNIIFRDLSKIIIRDLNKKRVDKVLWSNILESDQNIKWIIDILLKGMSMIEDGIIKSIDVLCYAFVVAEKFMDIESGAFAFHVMLAGATSMQAVNNCKKIGTNICVISGGVFQNEILLGVVKSVLKSFDINVFHNVMVPCNDEGISVGQAYYAISHEIKNKR